MTSPRTLIAALAAGTFALVACSAGSTDFKDAAEKAIKSENGGLGKGSTATCEKPSSTDVGTTFECTGTAADGTVYAITATIDKKDHVLVNSTGIVSGGTSDSTGETTADTAATDTTVGS
jgi:hypothetical protein